MTVDARRALVVGIDDYPTAPLAGCVNDAKALEVLLAQNHDGSPNFSVRLLTSDLESITRAVLREQIERLFADAADVALFYFSGHGTENNLGGYLVTTDAARYDEGVSLTDVLTLANNSPVHEVVILLDSCFSGSFGQVPAVSSESANLREGVTVMTASRASQTALEVAGRGVFTELICGALEGGAADVLGNVAASAVYTYVEQALGPWDQRPLYKAHVSRTLALRETLPSVDVEILRQLPQWFSDADSVFPLDPSYEPLAEPSDPERERVFGCLQKCRAAHLVEPVDEEHMYFAAIHGTGCRLTPIGRHFWRLVNSGRV
jgi:hypothetical protein